MNVDLAMEFEEERSQSSDEAYAAVGRALTFATRLEAHCRVMAMMPAVKERFQKCRQTSEDEDQAIASVTAEYWYERRFRHHTRDVSQNYRLPENVKDMVGRGLKARNELVHELTVGLPEAIRTDAGRNEVLHHLAVLVEQLAEADRIVALLIHLENGDPLPSSERYESHIARAVAWVCEVED
ncbi:MAG: hypothetical protein HY271_19195 [Deltaproteobacteria bacterium]|nr:hypothetical protein [Deltaproteobacteria bacterium]